MAAQTDTGAQTVDAQAEDAVAITKSDTTVYTPPLRGIYVGTTGDVAVITARNMRRHLTEGVALLAVVFPAVPAGAILPIHASQVMSTGTAAGGLVGLFG